MTAFSQPVQARQDKPDSAHIIYDIYNRDLHVFTVEADYELTPDHYMIRSHFYPSGLVNLFVGFDMVISVKGTFQNHHVAPQIADSFGKSKGVKFHTLIDFHDPQKVEVKTLFPAREKNRDPVTEAQDQNSIDLISAMLDLIYQVRSGYTCEDKIKIFDGLKLFDFQSHTLGDAPVPSNWASPYKGKSLVCKAVIQQTGGLKQSRHRALMAQPQPGYLWFQSIGRLGFLPVRFEFKHPKMGTVTAILQKVRMDQ